MLTILDLAIPPPLSLKFSSCPLIRLARAPLLLGPRQKTERPEVGKVGSGRVASRFQGWQIDSRRSGLLRERIWRIGPRKPRSRTGRRVLGFPHFQPVGVWWNRQSRSVSAVGITGAFWSVPM